MASIINTVAFKNFFNYYGEYEETQYSFEEGINIIVADNGAGKSKFFNAFLWLFYDQVLDSDDKIKKGVKDIPVKIISDKAKFETPIGESVETGILVEYSTGLWKYKIKKSFTATRLAEDITSSDSWSITMNDLEVDRTDHVLPKYTPIYDTEDKEQIIKKLILPNLRQYSFFQGEEVDSIIDFGKKSSIEEAVRTLTDISDYEKLVSLTKYLKENSEKDLKKQMKSNSDHNERLDIAIKLKEDLDKSLGNEEVRLKQYNSLYDEAEKEKSDLEQNFSNAEKRKELDDKIKEKNSKVKGVSDDYYSFLDGINSRFFDGNFSWISKGFDSIEADFQKKIEKYREQHFAKKALKNVESDPNKYFHFLPLDSPDSVSLKNMIDKEHCFVCNREAKEGSDAHNHFIKLKNRAIEVKTEVDYVKNNFNAFFDGLQINAQPFYNKIPNIPQSILSTREKESGLNDRLTKLTKELKILKDQRKDILISGTEEEDALTIINRYKGSIRRLDESKYQIEKIGEKIKSIKNDISNTEKEIQNLKPSDIPEGYSLNYQICSDLLDATENAKERVYDNMISLLEENANKHFQNLIKHNSLAGGILKFDKTPSDSIIFNYVDSSGNLVSGSSEGFQRMKKFSVVMAVISANTSKYNYPLLADAPISAFGEGFTEGFFESTGNVFPQSIILVKDLYKDKDEMKINELGKKLLTDANVKTFYVNQVQENVEQIQLQTTKIKLK
ncbi:MAG: AAA family ATPase [Weeksellaceae bacterium]|nr:AAA family ATPase [Weeksellaceae bacterium]